MDLRVAGVRMHPQEAGPPDDVADQSADEIVAVSDEQPAVSVEGQTSGAGDVGRDHDRFGVGPVEAQDGAPAEPRPGLARDEQSATPVDDRCFEDPQA